MTFKNRQKIVILITIFISILLFSGFKFINPENTKDIKNKTINLKYMDKNFILALEEFCGINTENNMITVNEEKLKQKVKEIANNLETIPLDASIVNNKTCKVQREINGVILLEYELIQNIKEYISSGNLLENITLDIPAFTIKPWLTEEILNKIINTEIASFSTKFNPSQTGRTENLRISTEAINGILIYPGEIFSLSEALGEITVKKGYKNAPIFSGGKVVNGLGGGICQTSTTFYNASLLANLEIIERHKHMLSVTYINRGRDATIYKNVYDLKVKNNYEYPVCLKSYIDKSKGLLTVKIFGYSKDYNIKITTEKQIKNKKSYYMTYRYIYDLKNKLLESQLISTDIFK